MVADKAAAENAVVEAQRALAEADAAKAEAEAEAVERVAAAGAKAKAAAAAAVVSECGGSLEVAEWVRESEPRCASHRA